MKTIFELIQQINELLPEYTVKTFSEPNTVVFEIINTEKITFIFRINESEYLNNKNNVESIANSFKNRVYAAFNSYVELE